MKQNFFSKRMATLSDSELDVIVNSEGKYDEDAILAATWELEKRGSGDHQFVEQEIIDRQTKLDERKKKDSNYTTDPNAPQLYPKWSIWLISVLFTPLIGGIMLAINFNRTGHKKQIPIVLLFSIAFTIIVVITANYLQEQFRSTTLWTNFLNLIGGAVLSEYFWRTQIGVDFKYRKRSPLIPFVISIAITVFLVWAATLE